MRPTFGAAILGLALIIAGPPLAQTAPPPTAGGDIPAAFKPPTEAFDFDVRHVDIPMRDGIKLHTVIVVPKGAHGYPMLLDRTPYNAEKRVKDGTPHLASAIGSTFDVAVQHGYIFVSRTCAESTARKATTS